jgi:hypothetical protein
VKFLVRLDSHALAWLMLAASACSPAIGQTSPTAPPVAVLRTVAVVNDPRGIAVEIISNHPITPALQKLDNPRRLVIDLPNTRLVQAKKRLDFRNEEVKGVRVDQFQADPPVARVVVDLAKAVDYTWDAAGNRLMIRLRPVADEDEKPAPTVAGLTTAPQPGIVPSGSASSGAVVLAGNRLAAGSAITAGSDTAILHLPRGGQVRVCPGTTVSVTPSPSGRDLMLGMSTGAMETHYKLETSADSILTPDFRIMLAGPGEFDYAISVDRRGDTCVRALPGNTASAIISELMGDGTYQVKPAEQILFRAGRLRAVDTSIPADCGCPEPATPLLRTAAPVAPVLADANPPDNVRLAPASASEPMPISSQLSRPNPNPAQVSVSVAPEASGLPASRPTDVHVEVEAPFVFRAADPVPPPPVAEASKLPLTASLGPPPIPASMALPPDPPVVEKSKAEKHGFFHKLGGFFAAIFR